MFDFPASPTTGTVSNGYVYDGIGWAGGPGVSGPVTEQFFDMSGKTAQDITVPSWAKGAAITASIIPPAAGQSVVMRVSLDGTTFMAGASDYSSGNPFHISLPSSSYTANANALGSFLLLGMGGTNIAVPQQIDAHITLERRLTSETFSSRSYFKGLDTTNGMVTGWMFGHTTTTNYGSVLRLAALRILWSQGGTFGNGSFIKVRWIGDSAAIPQSNAIADAPSDGAWYLRQSGAWLKTSALPYMVATRNTNAEVIQTGINYGIIGVYTANVGGWTNGAGLPGGGTEIVVPRTGLYYLNNRAYYQPVGGKGRLELRVNGIPAAWTMPMGTTDGVVEASVIVPLSAGDKLSYAASVANAGLYHSGGHTQITAAMIGAL